MKWIEIIDDKRANKIIGVIYRHPNKKDIDFIQKFSKILQLTRKEKERIFITGGFNYDLLTYTKNEIVNEFITLLYENLLQPCIIQPTRVDDYQKPTLIDNIFANTIDAPISGNLIDRISDHFRNFVIIVNEGTMVKPDTIQYKRNMVNFNPTIFTTALTTNFAKTNYVTQNANELGKNIIDTFTNTLDSLTPMRKMTKKDVKSYQKPWLTKGILNSIKIKTEWLKKFIKSKNNLHYKKYKTYRDKSNSLIRISKRNCYKKYFTEHLQNTKKIMDMHK